MIYRKKKDVLLEEIAMGQPFMYRDHLYIAADDAEINVRLPKGEVCDFLVDDTMVTPLTMIGFREELKCRGMIPQ